jgi:glycogen phosphorylase
MPITREKAPAANTVAAQAILDTNLKEAIEQIAAGVFSAGDRGLFRPIVESLLNHDQYIVLAEFASYLECQCKVDEACRDQSHWTRMSILNVARAGNFSSDRSIREYCAKIWGVRPVGEGQGSLMQIHLTFQSHE